MKHVNVALFVPHEGCPHRCSFCNQRSISGQTARTSPGDVDSAVAEAVASGKVSSESSEIAFFGGSFTAIPREYMISLLNAAEKYVADGTFKGIRVSTRPDAVDREICDILRSYRVSAVELGAQSMDDNVLALNRRAHTSADVVKAARLLKEYGFETGLQMMTGLYGGSAEESLETARDIAALEPDTVRVYPTVVMEDTELAALCRAGKYIPPTLGEAVELCSRLLEFFESRHIRIIRLGLHSGGGVEDGYVAGAYHPAFRELCESEIYCRAAFRALAEAGITGGRTALCVPPDAVSKMAGQHRSNLIKLKNNGFLCSVRADGNVKKYSVKVNIID